MSKTALRIAFSGVLAWMLGTGEVLAQPCLIFVHGKQTNTDTFTNWSVARNYWVSGSRDFIRTATKNFATSYYVVGYNGTQPWWGSQAAGEVANEIVNATNGGADGGGNRCARTWSQGGTFWVIAHSMGGTIMDFILGNNDPTDPNYNFNGPYDTVAQRISLVITLGGAHRGSQGADAVCGDSSFFCNFLAAFIQSCDTATFWLRSDDAVQVRTYSNSPARNVYLTGGYEAIFGASACLSGEDDGIVQHASQYACNGSATTGYDNSNVCGNSSKQESSGFRNLDVAHENHSDERNDTDRDTRRQIPDGIWLCGGSPCAPNTIVQSSMSTAQFVSILY
ncbi:MAG: hypothetical protein KatS3mg076_3192 [Candidatus Binatia bacterium]|nr:MAG: hypothetical protein KatS3mg076_3192 [Candidatus Binatia bacterium]